MRDSDMAHLAGLFLHVRHGSSAARAPRKSQRRWRRPGAGRRVWMDDLRAANSNQGWLGRHGFGSHLGEFAFFLKFELVMKVCVRYVGSSTTVVTTNQSPASGWVKRAKCSVIVALSLLGTP